MVQSPKISRPARPVSLVVMEAGAVWPQDVVGTTHADADCVVLGQNEGEGQIGFSKRVAERVRELVSKGASLRLGVVSAGENRSEEALDARYRITRALAAAQPQTARAELVLVARESDKPRHDLFGLAGVLCEALGSSGTVRVKLATAA